MACSYARSFVSSASKVLKLSARTFSRSRRCLLLNDYSGSSNSVFLQRGFTRSHWVLSGDRSAVGGANAKLNTTCGCSRLHTEVDKELTEFLDKEIALEKETSKKRGPASRPKDFEVKTDGANVTLTRKLADETISIKFNINNSVDADGPEGEEYGQEQADLPIMISRPPFIVEINKGGKRTLSLQCSFSAPDGADPEQAQAPENEEAIVDSYEINEVALHEGEWEEEVYSLQSDVMDGNLYDLMMDMLDERGITEEFTNQMVEYATAYEHSRYVEFLEGLQTFTKNN